MTESFHTYEGTYRILVAQVIDGKTVDWHLVERRHLAIPDKVAAHTQAVKSFTGRKLNRTGEMTETGWVFSVVK